MNVLEASYETAAAGPEGYPAADLPEIAILGRSNVGKSSLINKLVNRRRLAHTSGTPGKTRLLHFYRVRSSEGNLRLVDFPGYGHAKVAKSERKGWQTLVEAYLQNRESLRGAVLLQDLRRDVTDQEEDLANWMKEREIPLLLALTKADKLPNMRRAKRVRELRAQCAFANLIIPTSARLGFGIEELWQAMCNQIAGESSKSPERR